MIRNLFPDRIAVYNGVAIRDIAWLNGDDYYPNAKAPLTKTIREVIEPGDRVVHVGGGKGIAVVRSAEWAYRGEVVVYEVAAEMVDVLRSTRRLNNIDYEIIHGAVGKPHDPYGSTAGAKQYETEDIEGDLLVLDCEGAELEILPAPQFDRVVVETHPDTGATAEAVLSKMSAGEVNRTKIDGERGEFVVRT